MFVKSRGGKWYAHCYYYDAAQDKRVLVRKSTGIRNDGTAASRKRAESSGAEIERRLTNGLDRVKSKTISEAFAKRTERLELRKAPRATITRAEFSAAHVFWFFGPDLGIDALTTDSLAQYVVARVRAGAKHDTAARELADFRAAVNVVAKGQFPELPELPNPVVGSRWLTPNECRALIKACPPKRARAVLLALQTGCRKEEVYHVVRLRAGVGRVTEFEEDDGLKTGERTIPLTPIADAILSEGVIERWHNAGRDLKRYAKAAVLGRVTWNDLRRTTATQLVLAGLSTAKVAAILGHKSTRMVERIYARVHSLKVTAADLAVLPQYVSALSTVRTLCEGRGQSEPAQAQSSLVDSSDSGSLAP